MIHSYATQHYHRISADWCTTKPIAPFSCTPRVQQVHTKAEVIHLTPCTRGVQENGAIGLVVHQSAEIL